jgi:hypothetical protein
MSFETLCDIFLCGKLEAGLDTGFVSAIVLYHFLGVWFVIRKPEALSHRYLLSSAFICCHLPSSAIIRSSLLLTA